MTATSWPDRAIWPIMKFIRLISGVPAIGAPDFIETVDR